MQQIINILKDYGLPTNTLSGILPPKKTNELLSYTDYRHIYLGTLIRVIGTFIPTRITETILHELLHIYVHQYPPHKKEKAPFLSRAWNSTQQLSRIFCLSGEYVSAYARTQPEEDFVESAKYFLLGKESKIPIKKRTAIALWLTRVCATA
jgi:hypothetical protein